MADQLKQRNVIGERLSVCRQNKKMTQGELANRVGVTPQALSKWERGMSFPDVLILVELADILEVSTDYLLGVEKELLAENGDKQVESEIWNNLRESLQPLEIIFGKGLVCLFEDNVYKDKIVKLRIRLSKEGILMPIVRVRDEMLVWEREFMILSYGNVIYHENIGQVDGQQLEHILSKLEDTVRSQYFEIINPDIMKSLVDNLKIKYPALIEGIIPQKISYGLLTNVVKKLLQRGDSIVYLPKMIEIMDRELLDDEGQSSDALADKIAAEIEKKDNFYSDFKVSE